jgi:hypothetical protein
VNLSSRHIFRVVLLTVVFTSGAACAFGQTNVDAVAGLRTAVKRFDEAKVSRTRYTYLDLNHTQNFNEQGKQTVDDTQLFEVTYIGEAQFARLLQKDGHPLEGRALQAEQKRYDDAVREHSALDDKARAKIQHHVMKEAGVSLSLLRDHYKNRVAGHEEKDGRDCVLIESDPMADAPQKHYRVWLDAAKREIMRMEFDQLTDQGDMLRGSSGMKTWTYLEDVPLVTASRIDAVVPIGEKKRVRVLVEHTYSRFRKFSVTSKVVEVEP